MQANWIKITEKEPPFDEPILVYCPTGEGHIEPARFNPRRKRSKACLTVFMNHGAAMTGFCAPLRTGCHYLNRQMIKATLCR